MNSYEKSLMEMRQSLKKILKESKMASPKESPNKCPGRKQQLIPREISAEIREKSTDGFAGENPGISLKKCLKRILNSEIP